MNRKTYDFENLPVEVKEDIINRKIDEIVDMTERSGYVASLPENHYIHRAIRKAEEMGTPWFLSEYLFESGKDEIISEVSMFQYDYFGNRVTREENDSKSKKKIYILHFVEDGCSMEITLHMTPEEALAERKDQIKAYCRIFRESVFDSKKLADIKKPYFINDYSDTYWAIYECEMPHELKLLSYQYSQLRKCFNEHVERVLGKEYYNEGMDVYTCDRLACRDIERKIGSKGLFRKAGK